MQYPSHRFSSELTYQRIEDPRSDIGTLLIVHDIISSFTKIYYTGISHLLLKRIAENFWAIIREKEIDNLLPHELIKELLFKIRNGTIAADLFNGVLNMLYSDLASFTMDSNTSQGFKVNRRSRVFNKENEFFLKETPKYRTLKRKVLTSKSKNQIENMNEKSDHYQKKKIF